MNEWARFARRRYYGDSGEPRDLRRTSDKQSRNYGDGGSSPGWQILSERNQIVLPEPPMSPTQVSETGSLPPPISLSDVVKVRAYGDSSIPNDVQAQRVRALLVNGSGRDYAENSSTGSRKVYGSSDANMTIADSLKTIAGRTYGDRQSTENAASQAAAIIAAALMKRSTTSTATVRNF
jgi:hypothetical protein